MAVEDAVQMGANLLQHRGVCPEALTDYEGEVYGVQGEGGAGVGEIHWAGCSLLLRARCGGQPCEGILSPVHPIRRLEVPRGL